MGVGTPWMTHLAHHMPSKVPTDPGQGIQRLENYTFHMRRKGTIWEDWGSR